MGGKSLLRRHLDAFAALGIPDVVVVVGYRKDEVVAEAARGPADIRVRVVENSRYLQGDVPSLWHACQQAEDDVLIVDAAVLFPQEMLARLLATPDTNAIAVDEGCRGSGEGLKVICEDGWVVEVAAGSRDDPRVRGRTVGMLRLSADAADVLRGILEEFVETGKESLGYEDAFGELAGEVPVGVVEVGDLPWIAIGGRESLERARETVLPHVERFDGGGRVPAP